MKKKPLRIHLKSFWVRMLNFFCAVRSQPCISEVREGPQTTADSVNISEYFSLCKKGGRIISLGIIVPIGKKKSYCDYTNDYLLGSLKELDLRSARAWRFGDRNSSEDCGVKRRTLFQTLRRRAQQRNTFAALPFQ